jgi:hypothetical protein
MSELAWIELDPPLWIWPDPTPAYVAAFAREAAALLGVSVTVSGPGNPRELASGGQLSRRAVPPGFTFQRPRSAGAPPIFYDQMQTDR